MEEQKAAAKNRKRKMLMGVSLCILGMIVMTVSLCTAVYGYAACIGAGPGAAFLAGKADGSLLMISGIVGCVFLLIGAAVILKAQNTGE